MTLVTYYPLRETSGSTAYDYSGNENHGTINGATVGQNAILSNTAYEFDGTGDYVNASNNQLLNMANEFTISFWVNPNTASTNPFPVNSFGSNTGISIQILTDNTLASFYYYNTSGDADSVSTTETAPNNVWTHVTVTRSPSNYIMYLNGVEVGKSSVTSPPIDDDEFELGARQNGADKELDGRLAEVRIYDHALSPIEVQYLYQSAVESEVVFEQ